MQQLQSLILLLFISIVFSQESFYDYCVIGAGPGGLQIAHQLQNAGRQYVVFEKGPSPGTFYHHYPIHRKLISINKRFTNQLNDHFNMRHDWNSLLSNNSNLRMTKYSKLFFPEADTLVTYLRDYANELNLHIQFNTQISKIGKLGKLFIMNNQHNDVITCNYVIVATGIAKPNFPQFEGSEHTIGYEEINLDLNSYLGKSVLILGSGNAAFETADHLLSVANHIHLISMKPIALSWATHYVGDLRAVNNGLLDTYQLKSLDGILTADVTTLKFIKDSRDGKIFVTSANSSDEVDMEDALRSGYDVIIRCLGFNFDTSIFDMEIGSLIFDKYPQITSDYQSSVVSNLYFAGTNTHSLDFRKSAGGFIHGFRYSAIALSKILEWRNHGNRWPSIELMTSSDLINHIMKRLNEASDLWQMFSVLCDVIIHDKQMTSSVYLEAVPCSRVHQLSSTTGYNTDDDVIGGLTIVALEYGKNFSGVGENPFRSDRAIGNDWRRAHRANFLHPVLYHFNKIFDLKTYENRPEKWILPIPDYLLNLAEDFTTRFDAQFTHIKQLRRYFHLITRGHDLRHFFASQCLQIVMTTSGQISDSCRSDDAIVLNDDFEEKLKNFPSKYLPFRDLAF